jgi:hypothetical protein
MEPKNVLRIVCASLMLTALSASARPVQEQDAKMKYPKMAPVEQYMMEREAEIALARSAAPESISRDAEVMVLGRHGYEVAAKGKSGFVCVVERAWMSPSDDLGFWNPKLRGPLCLNAPAVRSYLPRTIRRTEWILAGRSKAQMFEDLKAAVAKNDIPPPEPGAMAYMLSKQQYLGDGPAHWHPHLMFFLPPKVAGVSGADLPGSPLMESKDVEGGMTVMYVPVGKWSDGTADSVSGH